MRHRAPRHALPSFHRRPAGEGRRRATPPVGESRSRLAYAALSGLVVVSGGAGVVAADPAGDVADASAALDAGVTAARGATSALTTQDTARTPVLRARPATPPSLAGHVAPARGIAHPGGEATSLPAAASQPDAVALPSAVATAPTPGAASSAQRTAGPASSPQPTPSATPMPTPTGGTGPVEGLIGTLASAVPTVPLP